MQRAGDVVVDYEACGVGGRGQGGFVAEGAAAPAREEDLPHRGSVVVVSVAAELGDEGQFGGDVRAWAVGHAIRDERLAFSCGHRLIVFRPGVDLKLSVEVVDSRRVELAVDVVQRVIMGGATEDSIALRVGIGEVMEFLRAFEEIG